MNTPEGHLSTVLEVKTFTLKINDDVSLRQMGPFLIKVNFEYYGPTKAKDWEEPDVPEYIGLEKINTINDIYLTNSAGLMCHCSGYFNFLDIVDEQQCMKICDALSLKSGSVKL